MGVASAGHRHGVVQILQAVVGLVFDRGIAGFLGHARLHAAALHHKAWNDTVKNRVVVVTLGHVGEEVGNRLGCFVLIEFEGYDAVVGDVEFDLWIAHDLFH